LTALLDHGLREILVSDGEGKIVGFLDETEITRLYREATGNAPR
jgi:CIC family chloride channel protein